MQKHFVKSRAFSETGSMRIEVRIDDLLKKRNRTFYWLSKKSGISHTTLWRLKKGKAHGINFATLEKICTVLDCSPGEVLSLQETKTPKKTRSANQG